MTVTTFDTLGYFEKLKSAGVPEEQAKIQAIAFQEFTNVQNERLRNELTTKGDLQDIRIEMKELEMRLSDKIEANKKWIISTIIAQTALIAAIIAIAITLIPNK